MQRQASHWKQRPTRVALVPTMGYLHEGHLSLVRRARSMMGPRGIVVVSIYVNPTQFAPEEDLNRYPRDLARDKTLCREAGADMIFVPNDAQMYPGKKAEQYSTYVVEQRLSNVMEGRSRPLHFRGVTTVVAKLFNIVRPDVAIFGRKDFQQAVVIRRMVRDLNFPVKLFVSPTVRERDGLAMSSRNQYLEGEIRTQAAILWQSIQKAQTDVRRNRLPLDAASLKKDLKQFIERQPAARVDYIEFFHSDTLQPLSEVGRGAHMALAVFVGKTRLIDNARL